MSVMSAKQEENNRNAKKKLFGWCVLIAVVYLFPHVQVVVGPCVELERDSLHVVKHQVGPKHVGDVRQSPRSLLRDTRHNVVEDL